MSFGQQCYRMMDQQAVSFEMRSLCPGKESLFNYTHRTLQDHSGLPILEMDFSSEKEPQSQLHKDFCLFVELPESLLAEVNLAQTPAMRQEPVPFVQSLLNNERLFFADPDLT